MLIALPSWSRRLKSGARTPLGMIEPSNFETLASAGAPVRLVAANTAVARASAPTITRAVAIRGFTIPRLVRALARWRRGRGRTRWTRLASNRRRERDRSHSYG